MQNPTKQSHSNNPIATIPFKKGEIVLVIDGIHQGKAVEIFDTENIYGKLYFWVIIGGCFSERLPLEFLSKKPQTHGETEQKPDHHEKNHSKSKETEQKNKGGRPSKFTEEVVRKLEEAFRCAGSDTDACAYAGISRETYYDWINPERKFSDNFTRKMQEDFIARINSAKVYPRIGCKRTLSQAGIKGDRRAAIEYLKRIDPDFKDKQETTLKGDAENPVQIFIPDNGRGPKK